MIEIADAEIREHALDPARSFIVGAPAGSGKTTLLTQRYLRLLSLVEQPESIVAITFTRKAAEEMRNRVLGALRAARDDTGEFDPVTQHWARIAYEASVAGGWRLLDNPRRLRMQTIDALAATVARRGPLQSGFAGDVAPLDDARPLYEQAARATIAELGSADVWTEPLEILLAHLDNNWERLERLLAEMLARRDQWLRFIMQTPERAEFEQALARTIAAELSANCAMLPATSGSDLARVAAYAGDRLALSDPDNERTCLAGLRALPDCDVEQLALWRAIAGIFLTAKGTWRRRVNKNDGFPTDDSDVREYKALFLSIVEELGGAPGALEALQRIRALPSPVYSDRDWTCLAALFRVLKLAAAQLTIEFEHAGAVDFAHIGQAAVAALGGLQSPSELQLLLDYQVQHLLVDEFQDTSIAQFELIERLVDGWSGGDGRSLFLVGDPMQSIYRFREADVSLFTDTVAAARLGSVPLEGLQLTTNFRARATLIAWLNDTVGALAEAPGNPYAGLPQLVAARAAGEPRPVTVHGVVADDGADEMQTVTEIVSASLAQEPAQRIGILVRSRTHLGSLGEKLREAGIAVLASDIDQLATQPVVRDLASLTRALIHVADRTAWLAILRAPWCGIDLRDLADLFEDARTETVVERLRDESARERLGEDAQRRLSVLLATMERGLALAGRIPIVDLVETTWITLGGPSCYGSGDLRHAERYFDLIATQLGRIEVLSPQRLEALLTKEYVAPPQQADASVEIMTIHAAKGLEFDVVILPGLDRRPQSESRRLLEWRAHRTQSGTELLFAPIESTGAATAPINAFLRGAEQREATSEAYRLLYVAMTRARERLHLVGIVKRGEDAEPDEPGSGTFLHMLWPAVAAELTLREDPGDDTPPVAERVQRLRRIVEPVGSPPLQRREAASSSGRLGLEFSWASPVAKHIGTVTHMLLQRISIDGLDAWPATRVTAFAPVIEERLRAVGVAPEAIPAARGRITEAVAGALASTRGRWILDRGHRDERSEYALTALADDRVVNIVIDRTFIDDEDQRWIIDFKTGAHAGGSPDAFVESEVERYRPQLERYAELLRQREARVIRLGLFFPLLDEWREWAFDPTADVLP